MISQKYTLPDMFIKCSIEVSDKSQNPIKGERMKSRLIQSSTIGCLFFLFITAISLHALDVNITGTVTDNFGTPVYDAAVSLKNYPAISAKSNADGAYHLTGQIGVIVSDNSAAGLFHISLRGNFLSLILVKNSCVKLGLYDMHGKKQRTVFNGVLSSGAHNFPIAGPELAASLQLITLEINGHQKVIRRLWLNNRHTNPVIGTQSPSYNHVATSSAGTSSSVAAVDTVIAAKQSYDNGAKPVEVYTGTADLTLVRSTLPFSSVKIPLSFKTTITASHTSVSNYGIKPQIALCANPDNTFDVALYMSATQQARIINFDSACNRTGEFSPAAITGARALLGFTRIPDDNSYVLGWSKDNQFGQQGFEYWITRFTNSATTVFSERIFGNKHKDTLWAKGEPGAASGGRIMYNAKTKKIGFYCGHTMLWDDTVRHQGGYMGFMDLTGKDTVCNDWFFSHNFDQRMVVVDSFYYALAHGDAYPRALGFSKWNDVPPKGKKLVDKNYFTIPGATGDNTTNTQTGGLIPLSDGTFGVLFGTKVNRQNYDVCYMKIGNTGVFLDTTWLTQYPSTTFAIFPRIAVYGKCILAMWEEVTATTPVVKAQVIDYTGAPVSAKKTISNTLLSPFYDLVTLTNGTVVWATLKGSDTLMVNRIEGR